MKPKPLNTMAINSENAYVSNLTESSNKGASGSGRKIEKEAQINAGAIDPQLNNKNIEIEDQKKKKENKAMWVRVKKKLRVQLGEDVNTSWFNGLSIEDASNGVVHLSVPTRFLQQWITNSYGERILSLLQEEQDDITRISVSVRSAIRSNQKQTQLKEQEALGHRKPSNAMRADDPVSYTHLTLPTTPYV